jgi:hypothetical protein
VQRLRIRVAISNGIAVTGSARGCGTKIVTPLRETEYELIERDGSVSLHPSIGNWNHPCQSHYWIRDNHIVWAGPMSKAAIQSERAYDDEVKAEHCRLAVVAPRMEPDSSMAAVMPRSPFRIRRRPTSGSRRVGPAGRPE